MGRESHISETFDQSVLDNRLPSVAHLFRDRAGRSPDKDALQYFEGDTLVHLTWAEGKDLVYAWAAGLVALDVQVEDRIAIASSTRYEWVIADMANMCCGAATTTVYPNTLAPDVAYLLADSGCVVVFAEDASQVEKLRAHRDEIPSVRKVISFDPSAADGDWVIDLGTLEQLGRDRLAEHPTVVDDRIDQLTPDHLATIIYTSGTTGRPKGAELTHDAFVYKGAAIHSLNMLSPDDLHFLWLPLSHVFGKVLLSIAIDVGMPTAVDGRIDRIVENMEIIKPTWMGAAPRIFEKAKGKIGFTLSQEGPPKAQLIDWAFAVGQQVAKDREAGRPSGPLLSAQHLIADKLVLSKIRERFGGRIRFFISGSAPLDRDVARWFASAGLLIIEGYGLTETSAATVLNRPRPGAHLFGSIGWPAPGTEVKIAPDGEILVKGPGVMRGYHNNPEATAEVMDDDGFFATGDIGEKDARGFIKITDRKKDVFKTSGGKYVAPSQIEAQFKGLCPYVSQFVVLGEGRNYASALVTLDEESIMNWARHHRGLENLSFPEVTQHERTKAKIQEYVDQLNKHLNRWETVKRFTILDHDFSIEGGELTPSQKLKRKVVFDTYADQIEGLYTG